MKVDIETLRQVAELALSRLRDALEEPVLVKYSQHVSLEIRPSSEKGVELVQVCREGWGWTCVNYTSEGLILDVFNDTSIESIHTAAIPMDELIEEED